jgi:flagellar assembly factor FliW
MAETNAQATLKVNSTRFGEMEVPADRVITLPQGMIGFPQLRRYVLIRHRDDSPFFWLQSLEAAELAFVMVNPLLFDSEYKFTLGNSETKLLAVEDPSQIQVWVVVTIPAGRPDQMTANLKAPLVINSVNRQGAQIILDDAKYSVRHPLAPNIGGEAGK